MSTDICNACGLVAPAPSHSVRQCEAKRFIALMEGFGYARVPKRRWTREFRAAGIPVIHGPVSIDRTGNWVQKWFLDAFIANRRRGIPLHLQVQGLVWWVVYGRSRASRLAP